MVEKNKDVFLKDHLELVKSTDNQFLGVSIDFEADASHFWPLRDDSNVIYLVALP